MQGSPIVHSNGFVRESVEVPSESLLLLRESVHLGGFFWKGRCPTPNEKTLEREAKPSKAAIGRPRQSEFQEETT